MIEGPIQTNNNGLVFYFDTKEPKSYVGEPTTNRNQQISNYTGTNYADGSHGGEWTSNPTRFTKTYNGSIITPIGFGATLCSESGTAGFHHLSSMGGGEESGAHSISCYVKPLNSITDFTIGMLGDGSNQVSFNLSTKAITYGGGISNRNAFCVEVSGFPGWLYVGANIEGRAGGWVGCVGISTHSSYTPTTPYKTFYITGLQYEYKVAPTKFTVGTRSNTQGLLDLTGNCTIDLTYAAYNSSSEITFNGSSRFTSSNAIFNRSNGQEITVTCWMKTARNAGQYQIIAENRSFDTSLYNWILYQHTDNGAISFHGIAQNKSTYIPPLNQWIYVANTVTSGGVSTLYINGVSTYVATGYTYGNSTTPSLLCVGGDGNGAECIQGSIDTVAIYNRALSASEILKNFNSQRSRYSV